MSNYINDIRKINNLIKENNEKELEDFLKNNEIDLNHFEKTTSPLKVAFSAFFTTKNFSILKLLIENEVDIFDDDFIFKLLKYRKHDEFMKVYELRKEEIDSYIRNGKDFLQILRNYATPQTVVYVDSLMNRKSEADKIYDSLSEVLLKKDKDYLIQHAEALKPFLAKSVNYFFQGIFHQNLKAISPGFFKEIIDLLKEVYDIQDVLTGKDNDNRKINVTNSLIYFLYKYKKSDTMNDMKKIVIDIVDDFYKNFTPENITKDSKEEIDNFFTFQNNIQSYLSKKETSNDLKLHIQSKLDAYKEREIYYPVYNIIFKDNMLPGMVNKLDFFSEVNFTKEDMKHLLKMPVKEYKNSETIKEVKDLMFCSLLVKSGVKQHKILNEFMEDENIFFTRTTPILEYRGNRYFPDDLLNIIFTNKMTILGDVLQRITDKESYFKSDSVYRPDLVVMYYNNIYRNVDLKNLKIMFDVCAKEGVDLKDVSEGTLGQKLLQKSILINNQKYELMLDYLKLNPDISANPTLAEDMIQKIGAFTDIEKVFTLCAEKGFFTKENFPETVVARIRENRNVDNSVKTFVEKAYMLNIVSQNSNQQENAVIRRKRM